AELHPPPPAPGDPGLLRHLGRRLPAHPPRARRSGPGDARLAGGRGDGCRDPRGTRAESAVADPVRRLGDARPQGRPGAELPDRRAGLRCGARAAPGDADAGPRRVRRLAPDRPPDRDPLRYPPVHEGGLRRDGLRPTGRRYPRVLARDHAHPRLLALPAVGAAVGLRLALGKPGRLAAAPHPAGRHGRGRQRGGPDAVPALLDAGGHAPGLRADGPGQRGRRAAGDHPPRPEERPNPDGDRDRPAVRVHARRGGGRRGDLRLARRWPPGARRDRPPRLPDGPGGRAGGGAHLRGDQPAGGHRLRRARPPDQVL
ncbi:MAG: Dipeptide transport system permease protein DppB, partial [uncultured Thermomicrobiales bacterium]